MIASAKRYMTAIAAAALIAVAVSACGGGGGGGGPTVAPHTPEDVALSRLTSGFMANAGTVTIKAGQSTDHGDIAFACAAGGDGCEVMVRVGSAGAITATSTGGTVTAMNSDAYQESLATRNVSFSQVTSGFMAETGTVTIKAGKKKVHGDIEFSCAAGRYDCEVMVAEGSGGIVSATKTGGTVTAMNAPGYPPGPKAVDLSNVRVGFMADAIMMLEIKAGESKNHGDITFSCVPDGRDCVVMVMVDSGGTVTATKTGGTVTAMNSAAYNTRIRVTNEANSIHAATGIDQIRGNDPLVAANDYSQWLRQRLCGRVGERDTTRKHLWTVVSRHPVGQSRGRSQFFVQFQQRPVRD